MKFLVILSMMLSSILISYQSQGFDGLYFKTIQDEEIRFAAFQSGRQSIGMSFQSQCNETSPHCQSNKHMTEIIEAFFSTYLNDLYYTYRYVTHEVCEDSDKTCTPSEIDTEQSTSKKYGKKPIITKDISLIADLLKESNNKDTMPRFIVILYKTLNTGQHIPWRICEIDKHGCKPVNGVKIKSAEKSELQVMYDGHGSTLREFSLFAITELALREFFEFAGYTCTYTNQKTSSSLSKRYAQCQWHPDPCTDSDNDCEIPEDNSVLKGEHSSSTSHNAQPDIDPYNMMVTQYRDKKTGQLVPLAVCVVHVPHCTIGETVQFTYLSDKEFTVQYAGSGETLDELNRFIAVESVLRQFLAKEGYTCTFFDSVKQQNDVQRHASCQKVTEE
ncbi:hypothetical protein [Pseudoalteromonas luteoviolacea]|uniref:Uncharacterized protein n=1 Tax=Pseudoalteromonas luteoviolacea S4054 TaxID=1129367 RepID=A0A0F6A8U2_9GAMM|nr:hypothetical protein [Pseudoalteromonas luteoviolacea]AOT10882.1 hypothetical protein S4054249_23855 [Pseudoalteromonas luteoviolacea]AOT15955.1 hypothetical protein S40542_24655 [Pseudoalteromonas luteoviolacea]AOT20703.1 hypothetical protein S4054_23775 [Pseudoalteromonas luteoviolacea]KKE81804.1 hypothetical protein N479_02260 [Pseudoalteromonas luteoviolacea S4054]KZN66238.1 hypothetical protein N481_24820 [Pseudoalteromonas luteoviolacea S4047-1]